MAPPMALADYAAAFRSRKIAAPAAAGLRLRPAARAHRGHAAGLARRGERRHRRDRLVRAGRPALHLQVPLGAAHGPLRAAVPRPAPRLAARHAARCSPRRSPSWARSRRRLRPGCSAATALAVAFLSASQDIVFDALRTDWLEREERGAGAAVSVLGYRIAMLVSGAGALILADQWLGWQRHLLADGRADGRRHGRDLVRGRARS